MRSKSDKSTRNPQNQNTPASILSELEICRSRILSQFENVLVLVVCLSKMRSKSNLFSRLNYQPGQAAQCDPKSVKPLTHFLNHVNDPVSSFTIAREKRIPQINRVSLFNSPSKSLSGSTSSHSPIVMGFSTSPVLEVSLTKLTWKAASFPFPFRFRVFQWGRGMSSLLPEISYHSTSTTWTPTSIKSHISATSVYTYTVAQMENNRIEHSSVDSSYLCTGEKLKSIKE